MSEHGEASGRAAWRSLAELARSPELAAGLAPDVANALARQAAAHGSAWDGPSRREFLRLAGASLSLAGLGACTRQPEERILPWGASPEALVPGVPRNFATAFALGPAGQGLLVESHMNRPTKIEGNPLSPSSLGAAGRNRTGAMIGLYDPDRSQVVLERGRIATWTAFVDALTGVLAVQRARGGAGLRVLSRTVSSPTLAAQRQAFLALFPQARWHQYEPLGRDHERAGALLAFGRDVACRYDFERADVVLSLGSDFLVRGPGALANARGFARARTARKGAERMSRLYAVECAPCVTGAAADHRLAVRPSLLPAVAVAFARALEVDAVAGATPTDFPHWSWVRAVASELAAHRGRSLVIAGSEEHPAVHAVAHALNAALGNAGATVVYSEPVEAAPEDQLASLAALVDDLRADKVEALVVLSANPLYEAPADLDFAAAFERAPFRAHLAEYEDETSARSHWHVPEAHFLESWSDVRGHDGTVSIVQPLIAPLYGGKSAHELAAVLIEKAGASGYDVVREHWRASGLAAGAPSAATPDADFESFWQRSLHDGIVAGSALPALAVPLAANVDASHQPGVAGGLELALRPDPHVWDGRFANNGWLQELPKPVTRLTWDNAALVGPRTAEEHGLADGVVARLTAGGATLSVPTWIVPGHPEGSLTLHLGYGRTHGGELARGAGVNAYLLQRSAARFAVLDHVTLEPTAERKTLACTQDHHGLEPGFDGREIRERIPDHVRVETFDRFARRAFEEHGGGSEHGAHSAGATTLLDPSEHAWSGHAWGMVIDLTACIGCSACTLACQAENNIPVVGREQVARGREMHWIRVDRYFTGDPGTPSSIATLHQPVPCMHCEQAPCELVCPVGATVHGKEGLNEMVYNRCVGTRYCSNNCPYKVRRFNFLQYGDWDEESLKLLRNPDVTVRSRGVMEKCTYCVQRIDAARIEAKKQDRRIADGEVVTACQQACPTQAIAFGDINDPASVVAALRREPHQYGLLDRELDTRPRTTYLAKVTNRNERLVEELGRARPAEERE